jgi:ribosomal protein L37AE/L43A
MPQKIPVVVDPLAESEEQEESCPMCGGPGMRLGTLGKTRWNRCRNCGTDFKGGA